MHENRIIIGQACSVDQRTFYPIIRDASTTTEIGGVFSSEPVGILIEENDAWFFVPLDGSVDPSVLLKEMESDE